MMRSLGMAVIILLAGIPLWADEGATRIIGLIEEIDRIAEQELWPGFDPLSIPLAIVDGNHTFFIRHPNPPAGAGRLPDRPDVVVHEGVHPAITANSHAEIGGVLTATVMQVGSETTSRELAELVIHEMFHVFQRENHPGWSANEADLFTYPAADVELLTLRRMETTALARALWSAAPNAPECMGRAALDFRQQRFALMPAEAVEYERKNELNEGLATWIANRATNRVVEIPELEGFGPEEIRQRGYATGAALAHLLDRFSSDWRSKLESNDALFLDEMLSAELEHAQACSFPDDWRQAIEEKAAEDVSELQSRKTERRREFFERPGWRLVVTATRTPLFPQGFDPLNVEVVGPGEVLHSRFVRLGNESGSIEVLGRSALSESAGEHPMFEGVSRITVTGLEERPKLVATDDGFELSIDGIELSIGHAELLEEDKTITLRIKSPR